MTSMVYRLLKGYLVRSVWLYAFLGAVQFLMVYLTGAFERVPLVGVVLGIWGNVAALDVHSLVWRSLPLARRDASVFRWWAIAGVPGVFLTLLALLAWGARRFDGMQIPNASAVWLNTLAVWAALGLAATLLPFRSQWIRRKFGYLKYLMLPVIYAIALCYGMLLAYGLPTKPGVLPYSIIFVIAGILLVFVNATRAWRGAGWRWPDIQARRSRTAGERSTFLALGYGVSAILVPLVRRTLLFAVVATFIAVSLLRMFPQWGVALFWVYFIGISTAGFLFTYQVRRAIQPLRCLPLSAKRLALFLQLFGALPGLITLGLTLVLNRVVLNVKLDVVQIATFSLVIISSQALPLWQATVLPRGKFLSYWMPLIQRILVPAYIGLLAITYSDAFGRFTWMRWPLQAAGVVLCIIGYFILVHQLRSGIRPSAENVLSIRLTSET